MDAAKRKAAPGANRHGFRNNVKTHAYPTKTRRLPDNWRDRLPDPARYYAGVFERIGKPNASGWALVRCPFHDDKHASLSVQMIGEWGGFTCFACGAKGDLLAFHMRRSGLAFADAVRDLLRGGA